MFFFIARQARSKSAAARRRAAEKLGAGGRVTGDGSAIPRNVALLLDLARDAEPEVRAAAYESLAATADRRAIEGVVSSLKDIEKLAEPGAIAVRDAAARTLQGIGGDALPALLRLSKDKSPKLREIAITAMGGIGGADVEAALVAALQDSRSSVRQAAIHSLARTAAEGSIGSLQAALDHRDPATRKTAVEALSRVKGAPAVQALRRLTRDSDRGVREATVKALASQASAEAVEVLLAVFEGQDREMRGLAAAALKDLDWQPTTAAQRALRAMLKGDYEAAAAEGQAAVEPLAALLADKTASVRKAAIDALGATAHESAIKPLMLSLQDSDAAVRQAAADALVRLGPMAVRPVACAVHEAVKLAAGTIVVRIGPAAAEPLLDILEHGEVFHAEGLHPGQPPRTVTRVRDDEDAERAEQAHHLIGQLLDHVRDAISTSVLTRMGHVRDVVRVRDVLPTNPREAPTTVVDTVVDCHVLRERAMGIAKRRTKTPS